MKYFPYCTLQIFTESLTYTRRGSQGTRVQSLVREDSTGHSAAKPVCTTPEPLLQSPRASATEAQARRVHTPQQGKPPQRAAQALQSGCIPHSLQLEKALVQQWRPSAAKHKQVNNFFFLKRRQWTQSPTWNLPYSQINSPSMSFHALVKMKVNGTRGPIYIHPNFIPTIVAPYWGCILTAQGKGLRTVYYWPGECCQILEALFVSKLNSKMYLKHLTCSSD